EDNPRIVFERLFGDGATAEQQRQRLGHDRSILDWVTGEIANMQKRLGARDRTTVDEYLEGVRAVERRIQKMEERTSLTPTENFNEIPDDFPEFAKLMVDLQFLAFQADITRVSTLQLSREQSNQTYPWIGVRDPHHVVSHHGGDPEKIAGYT